ncbi:kielin/chordin-like protein [Archocentrus centrarchus]|uniref:kielin/chordin-like protein n=1 Tax=Archocentrus centrarchus TaxID=63155 RepID=UPI0011E9E453|nr:kielin/chordin-like protein [Archocentrus centrarchus]
MDTHAALKVGIQEVRIFSRERQPCPSQPCPSQEWPSQPCPSQPCPSHECPSQPCPSQERPSQPCPSQPCPPQPCPSQECPSQPCPSQPCPSHECPSQPCPSQESPSQPCPSQPCPSHECPSQPCPSQECPSQSCPSQPCPPQPCPSQPCPTQVCKEDCERHTCVEVNRECPQQPCPPQPRPQQPCPPQPRPPQECPPQACPIQNCKEENVPDCQRRSCEGGNRECLTCSEENVPEGCEQQTTSCTHSGESYNHGDSWRSVENPCDICSCSEGQVHCEREQCNTGCRNPAAPPPNSCCPVCDGCGVNGYDFPNGAVMPAGDPCQECRCVDGNIVCSPVRCPALSCRNPVYHAGECCPRCEQCQFESKIYENGETFTSRRHPCLQCHCSAGEVSCEHMAASCPTPHCSHPAKHRGQCCPTCSDCEYERRVYTDGTSFTPPGSGPCLQCRCKGGNVLCNEEKCPPVHCSNPVRDPNRCCPVCKNQ